MECGKISAEHLEILYAAGRMASTNRRRAIVRGCVEFCSPKTALAFALILLGGEHRLPHH